MSLGIVNILVHLHLWRKKPVRKYKELELKEILMYKSHICYNQDLFNQKIDKTDMLLTMTNQKH